MPGAGFDFERHLDGGNDLAFDHFVEGDVFAQPADADDVEVGGVLKTEDDAGHLLADAADEFEAGGELEVAEHFAGIDAQGIMLIRGVLAGLREHAALGHVRRLVRQWREDRRHGIHDHLPRGRLAGPGEGGEEVGRLAAGRRCAEVELHLRAETDSANSKPNSR